jgi:hypothetical protein
MLNNREWASLIWGVWDLLAFMALRVGDRRIATQHHHLAPADDVERLAASLQRSEAVPEASHGHAAWRSHENSTATTKSFSRTW